MNEQFELLEPKEFWKQIDLMLDILKEWVLENCKDAEYQCCSRACNIFYSMLVKWGIEKYREERIEVEIVTGKIQGVTHDWVEISNFIFDPTVMQFKTKPEIMDYTMGFLYQWGEEDSYDVVLNHKGTQVIADELLKKFYNILEGM